MRSLASKTNSVAPGGDYPYGRTKDDTGAGDGTPVNEATHGDFHQFFEKLMDDADITPNGQPENSATGFQLNIALAAFIKLVTKYDALQMVIGSGLISVGTGFVGYLYVKRDCTIVAVELMADASGSIVIDIKKANYAGMPTTASIVASAPPTLSSAQKSQDNTLTGWTKDLTKGDWLEIRVTSATTVKQVTMALAIELK